MKIKDFDIKGCEILNISNEVKSILPDKFKFTPHSKRPLSTTKVETGLPLSDKRPELAWNLARLSKLAVKSYLHCTTGNGKLMVDIIIIHDTNLQYEINRLVKRMLDVCTDEG